MTARRGRYLTGAAATAAYQAEARRRTTPRGDPQRTRPRPRPGPGPDPAERCACADTAAVHDLDDATGKRGACSVMTGQGPCGCKMFTKGGSP